MEYRYIKDTDRLAKVIETLGRHEPEIQQYFLAELTPRILALKNLEEKLVKLFTIANADRQYKGKGNIRLIESVSAFKRGLEQIDISKYNYMNPLDAHHDYLNWLTHCIGGMGQKTANLFIKYMVMFNDELGLGLSAWRSWKPYLHVPLDLWVLRLLGKDYLDTCNESYERDFRKHSEKTGKDEYQSLGFGKKYSTLQEDLARVAALTKHATITLDWLWFVGNKYCSYHPLLCDICWLRGENCRKKRDVDLDSVTLTPTAYAKKQAEKELIKKYPEEYKALLKEYMSEA